MSTAPATLNRVNNTNTEMPVAAAVWDFALTATASLFTSSTSRCISANKSADA